MSKESAAWLVLRVIGLIFLMCGIIQLYDFALNAFSVIVISNMEQPENGTLHLVNLRWDPVLHTIFLISAAIYFLWYGTFFHRLLTKEGST